MKSFDRSPEVLLDVFAENLTSRRNEVGDIEETLAVCILFGSDTGTVVFIVCVKLYDCARNDTDVTFFGQSLILFEIFFPACTRGFEVWVIG